MSRRCCHGSSIPTSYVKLKVANLSNSLSIFGFCFFLRDLIMQVSLHINFICRPWAVHRQGLSVANCPHVSGIWFSSCIFNILPYILLFWSHSGSGRILTPYLSIFLFSGSQEYSLMDVKLSPSACRMWFSWFTSSLDLFLWLFRS